MSYKTCKYGCNTQIVWNDKIKAFIESDGTQHDRTRCETLRPRGSTASTSYTQTTTVPRIQPSTVTTKTLSQESYDILSANQLEIIGKLDRIANEVKAMSSTVYAMQQDLIRCVKWIQAQTASELNELEGDRQRENPEYDP